MATRPSDKRVFPAKAARSCLTRGLVRLAMAMGIWLQFTLAGRGSSAIRAAWNPRHRRRAMSGAPWVVCGFALPIEWRAGVCYGAKLRACANWLQTMAGISKEHEWRLRFFASIRRSPRRR